MNENRLFQQPIKNKPERPENPERRKFLLGALAGVVSTISVVEEIKRIKKILFEKKLKEFSDNMAEAEWRAPKSTEEIKKAEEFVGDILEENRQSERDFWEITEEDQEMISQILQPDINKKMVVNEDVSLAIQKYWSRHYQNKGKRDLERAFDGIQNFEHRRELEAYFNSKEVPVEYMYLAIPESHWNFNADSGFAVGPYQFTEESGIKYKLIKTKTARVRNKKTRQIEEYDEIVEDNRKDPLKSGKACADMLADLYKKTKDWNLALAGYNGGFIWEYLKTCYEEKTGKMIRQPNFSDFLSLLGDKIESNRQKALDRKEPIPHRVKKGQLLKSIVDRYGLSRWDLRNLRELNRGKIGKKDALREGDILRIPITSQSRQAYYRNTISGLIENLNYPPKFNAVINECTGVTAERHSREMARKAQSQST